MHFRSLYTLFMKTKEEIVQNWLPRYTGRPLNEFDDLILLTNFHAYVDMFAHKFGVPIVGENKKPTKTKREIAGTAKCVFISPKCFKNNLAKKI